MLIMRGYDISQNQLQSRRKRFERILNNEDLKIQDLNFIDLMKAYFASFQDQYLLAKNYI